MDEQLTEHYLTAARYWYSTTEVASRDVLHILRSLVDRDLDEALWPAYALAILAVRAAQGGAALARSAGHEGLEQPLERFVDDLVQMLRGDDIPPAFRRAFGEE